VLDLCASAPVERVRVAILRKAQRVPIAEGRLHTELALKGGAGQPHVWPGGAKESVLEQHARDGHHGQAAVGELRIQRPLALVGTVGLALVERPAKVTCVGKVSRCAVRLLHIEDRIDEAHEGKDLHAASDGNLSKGLQAIWDVVERQAQGRRAKPGPTEVLGGDVAHARQHRDAAMLELTGAAALELHLVPILGEPQRVKEAHRGLNTELLLEGTADHHVDSLPRNRGGARAPSKRCCRTASCQPSQGEHDRGRRKRGCAEIVPHCPTSRQL